jgi:hypothetical protein
LKLITNPLRMSAVVAILLGYYLFIFWNPWAIPTVNKFCPVGAFWTLLGSVVCVFTDLIFVPY